MQFTDAVTVAGTRRTADGYLVADARIARTGIQLYLGKEVDPDNKHGLRDKEIVRVYRPGSEVFSPETMRSAAHKPVTNDHPPESVTADNWRKYAVGQTSDEVKGEGIYLRVPMMVTDAAAIADIESGKRELSAGYTCEIDPTAGVNDSGDAFDAIMRNIRFNHDAIVRAGRAGSEVRIGDQQELGLEANKWGIAPITTADERKPDMPDNLRTVMVDGLSVSVTDQGAQAIEKLTKDRADANKALADAKAEHDKSIAAKDAEMAKKDAEITDLKSKVLDAAALDKLVAARANLVTVAKAIAKDVKVEGLSDSDIKKAVVTDALGDAAVKDKSADYINARFDILAEDAAKKAKDGADPFRDAVNGGLQANDGDKAVTDAYAAMVKDMQSAHQPAKAN